MSNIQRLAASFALCVFALTPVCAPLSAEAQTANATIRGTFVDVGNGLPVTGATVSLVRGDTMLTTAQSDNLGNASFPNQAPGIYHLEVRAQGYYIGRSDDIVVNTNQQLIETRLTLQRSATTTGSNLREIGRTSSAARGAALQTTSTITQDISTERLQRQNYVRVGDALYTLPGVNLSSQDSAIGDDLSLNIRGIGTTESGVLLDGHQIGPFGAGGSSFNLQLTPLYALRNVQVTYGSGAQGLYGVDAIAGTVDLQTLNPTRHPEGNVIFGIGNQGKSETVVQTTGTINDKFGYALSSSVQGTYGAFKPGLQLQPGFLSGSQDFSSAGIAGAGALYSVTANYLLRDNLAKLTYQLAPKTNVSLTYYEASSFDDKTGNGDNDANGANYQFQGTVAGFITPNIGGQVPYTVGNATTTPCPVVTGSTTQGVIPVNTNSGVQCLSATQYSNSTYGANGGGPTRQQEDGIVDYTFRINQSIGNNNINVSAFTDNYQIDTTRSPKTQSFRTQTFGVNFSDDITSNNNDFGFGYYAPIQHELGDRTVSGVIVQNPVLTQSTSNFFIRDDYTVNNQFSLFANAWLKRSSVSNVQSFDPRLSLVFRPSPNDAIRVTGARVDNAPDVGLIGGVPSFGNPGSTNVICGGLTGIGSVPTPNLTNEQAKDVELAYGHRFGGDSQIQIAVYNTNVTNQIISTEVLLSSVPQYLNNPDFVAQLNDDAMGNPGYLTKFNRCPQFAGHPLTTAQQLAQYATVSSTLNAANGRYQGIEVSGRARVNRSLFFDYAYNVQSATFQGLTNATLQNSGTLNNGQQITGIPLQKAALGVDYTLRGFELRVDGFYVGNNNGYDRPAYTFFNGSLTKSFHDTTINIGVQNVFNSAYQQYGLIGEGVYRPYNPIYTAAQAAQGNAVPTDGVSQGAEEFGLAPRSIQFTLTQRVGRRQ